MTPIAGLSVLTAGEMRAAEARAVARGSDVRTLMERAGAGVASWTARLAAGAPVLVLCGPGNNGGDGYAAARLLKARGMDVRVAALAEPKTDAARDAARGWDGPVTTIEQAQRAPVVVDALLGTGASRAIDAPRATEMIRAARLAIAVDLPSGLDADSGRALGEVAACHITLALGALKPAHLLQPGGALCGAVRRVDIGVAVESEVHVLPVPSLPMPGPQAHKYNRGMVVVVAGAMPGAALLAAEAALRSGAGYVVLAGEVDRGLAALVRRPCDAATLGDLRVGCVLIGSGLGRAAAAQAQLDTALASGRPLVIDGDALHLIDRDRVPAGSVLTPHAGEFDALFGASEGASKLDRTRLAARASGAVVVHKGSDTVIAAPDGRATIAPPGSAWLSTAGTGDVLAGAIAAQRAAGADPFAAAQAGVWLHAHAADRLGAGFIADDLACAMTGVIG